MNTLARLFTAIGLGCVLSIMLGAAPAQAAPQLYRVPQTLGEEGGSDGSCALAGDTPVAAFGAYEGRQMTRTIIGKTPHETYIVPVTGPRAGPRRVLWLSAYEAVIWDFSLAPTNRIDAVVLSGYYDQAVMNLPAKIPVRFSSRSSEGPCGQIGYAYKGGPGLEKAALQFQQATSLAMGSFAGTYAVGALRLDAVLTPLAEVPQVRPGAIRSATTVATDTVAPREAGIAQLIAEGKLRPATRADVDWWNAAATARLETGRLASYRSEYLSANASYVVLKPMRIPRGMYGAHSSGFLIMPGVPDPVDPGSHNTYYRMADGTCRGTSPDCSALGR